MTQRTKKTKPATRRITDQPLSPAPTRRASPRPSRAARSTPRRGPGGAASDHSWLDAIADLLVYEQVSPGTVLVHGRPWVVTHTDSDGRMEVHSWVFATRAQAGDFVHKLGLAVCDYVGNDRGDCLDEADAMAILNCPEEGYTCTIARACRMTPRTFINRQK